MFNKTPDSLSITVSLCTGTVSDALRQALQSSSSSASMLPDGQTGATCTNIKLQLKASADAGHQQPADHAQAPSKHQRHLLAAASSDRHTSRVAATRGGSAGVGKQHKSAKALRRPNRQRQTSTPIPPSPLTSTPEPASGQAGGRHGFEAALSKAPSAAEQRTSQADIQRLKQGDVAGRPVSGFDMVVSSVRKCGRRDIMWRWTPLAPCRDPGCWLRSRPERERWIKQNPSGGCTEGGSKSADAPRKWKEIEAVSNGHIHSPPAAPRRVLHRQSLRPSGPSQPIPSQQENTGMPPLPSRAPPDARPPADPARHATAKSPSNASDGGGLHSTEAQAQGSGRQAAMPAQNMSALKEGDRIGEVLEGFERIFWKQRSDKLGAFSYWRPTATAWAPAPPTKRFLRTKPQLLDWLQQHHNLKTAAWPARWWAGMSPNLLFLSLFRYLHPLRGAAFARPALTPA